MVEDEVLERSGKTSSPHSLLGEQLVQRKGKSCAFRDLYIVGLG